MKPPDFWQLIAESRGVPPGWRWNNLKAIGESRKEGACVMTGAVYPETFKSGPRKGQDNPAKRTDVREMVITFTELDAFIAAWEQRTGLCSKCDGGQAVASSGVSGTTYKPCTACNAGKKS